MKTKMIAALMAAAAVCNAQTCYKETYKCEVSYEIQGTIPAGLDFKPEIVNVEVVHRGDSLFFSDCKCKMKTEFSFNCDSTSKETLNGYGDITKEGFYAVTIDKRRKQYSVKMKYKSLPKKTEVKINGNVVPSKTIRNGNIK